MEKISSILFNVPEIGYFLGNILLIPFVANPNRTKLQKHSIEVLQFKKHLSGSVG